MKNDFKFLKTMVFLMSSFFITACTSADKELAHTGSSPNVIFILTDQWRADALGYAGDPNVKTPNLDAFAKQAVNFSNTLSSIPVCTPYRASLLTGKFPTSTGIILNDLYLPVEEYCMAEMFVDAGYKTAYIGKWHLDGHGRLNNVEEHRRQGFEYWKALECSHEYLEMPYYENDNPEIQYYEGYSPYAKVKAANSYLEQSKKGNEPFLLFLSLATPHFPHNTALVNNTEMSDVLKELDDMLHVELQKIDDEPIMGKEYYLKKFGLKPNAGRYTYEYFDVEKADSPKVN